MIGFLLNYQILSIQKLLRHIRACSKLRDPAHKPLYYFAFTILISSFIDFGCAGPTIHSELRANPDIMTRRWTLTNPGSFDVSQFGLGYSNPLIAENILIYGNQNNGIVAIYPEINQQHWALPIPGGVISELTLDNGSIYFGGGDGYFYSVNLENGRINWRYQIRNPIVSKPTVSGGRVFLSTSDDTVYAFDAGTGKWLWHYRRRSTPLVKIYGASSPLVDGNEVLVGTSDGYLIALSLEEGQLKWEKRLHSGTKFTDINAQPVIENGIIYLPAYDGSLYALSRQGGSVLWKFDAGGSKTITLGDDHIYLPSSNGTIYALKKSNAKITWKFELDSGTPTQIYLTDKYVIVGSSYQYLYAIDRQTGKGLYRFDAGYGSGFLSSPGYNSATKRLYLLSSAGNLYSFSLKEANPK